jgi:Fe(3+) dicitrate transport protein
MPRKKQEMIRTFFLFIFFFSMALVCDAQTRGRADSLLIPQQDTSLGWDTQLSTLKRVDVYSDGRRLQQSIHDLPDFKGVSILSGKKYSLIVLENLAANLAENNARQIFVKVPGITAMEMDGSGVQVNIASRGLNPHRSSEFNVNQNGININSDLFGYPEVHYNPPMEAVGKIEVVKGSAALQYGPQYGGMINYILKGPDVAKVNGLGGETTVSLGSFGLLSGFTSLGGEKGKWRYWGYLNYRGSNGWRTNSRYDFFAGHGSVYYQLFKRTAIGIEVSSMTYTIQLAGGLTESQYAANPRQSTRQRNYYSPDITIPAFVVKSEINAKTSLIVKSYVLAGQRNSVAFIASPMVVDSINTKLGTLNPRQVDRDFYNSLTTDARLVRRYELFGKEQVFTSGIKLSRSNTVRKQFGKGTVNSDYDISLTQPGYGIDLLFRTVNQGVFVENLWRLTSRWSISPGLRFDHINSQMTGDLTKLKMIDTRYNRDRNLLMKGIGSEFSLGKHLELFSNYSSAYRPILHSDLIPSATLMEVDPQLRDSKGYNFDLGLRGNYRDVVRFDVSYFRLFYGNRIGNLTLLKPDGTQYFYRTNIGDALTTGLESMLDLHLLKLLDASSKNDVNVFCSYALNHARYQKGTVVVGQNNVDISGNKVEDVPDYIFRAGMNYKSRRIVLSLLYSSTGEMVSDANNTVYRSDGIVGKIPSYHVIDLNFLYVWRTRYQIKLGINNLENTTYFNRRVNNYLGPGILPAPGRSVVIGLTAKM